MRTELLQRLIEARRAKRPAVLATLIPSGEQSLYVRDAVDAYEFSDTLTQVEEALRQDRSRTVDSERGAVFLQVFNPPLRLFVIGAVHITQSLVGLSSMLGYDALVIDPRQAFATSERFPGVRLDTEWPDESLQAQSLDARSAVVTLTHDPKIDDPALEVALRSEAFYIGCLGSRKTHASRLQRLADRGFEATLLERIHGPVGLDIGARSPQEIAVAIVAQMTSVLRGGSLR
ncbi:MAG: XdhC family protein [Gammaproteobacteria bacterium]|nr:XdhC family protein [Gammaproteobacteria bacterium]